MVIDESWSYVGQSLIYAILGAKLVLCGVYRSEDLHSVMWRVVRSRDADMYDESRSPNEGNKSNSILVCALHLWNKRSRISNQSNQPL